MIISERQIMQLISIAQALLSVSMDNQISNLLTEIIKQQSTELKEVK